MGQLDKLEAVLDDTFKKVPYKMPENNRKSLAGALWWIALIFGVIQLWLAWEFWRLGHLADRFVDYANSLTAVYGGTPVSSHLGFIYYLTLIVVLVDAALLLLASPGLKAMRKAGWNLLFYSLLLNVVYGLVRMFSSYGGFGDLFWAVVSSAIGGYLLFQVRGQFTKTSPVAHTPSASPKV